jgi:hypothetical protein
MTKWTYQLTLAFAAIATATVVWANQDGKKCEGTCSKETSTVAVESCCKGKCDLAATVATSTETSATCCKGKCEGTETIATSNVAGCEKCEGQCTAATSTVASDQGCCKGKCEGTATVATSTATCEDCEGKCEGQCEDCAGCPITAAMEKLPKMTFVVGEETTCCPETAKKLADESGEHIHFVVAGKTYHDKAEAVTALAEETETFVTAFVKPQTCEVSGTTTVAGKSHSCTVAAGQTAALAAQAMKNVHLTYLVGDKQCDCPNEAKQMAEQTGKQTIYVVGKEKTGCNVTARLNLARAKYRAAVEAIVKASAEEKPDADQS